MSRSLKLYDRVVIVGRVFDGLSLPVGAVAYIVDVYDDGCFEVEISGHDGVTLAMVVAPEGDLELA